MFNYIERSSIKNAYGVARMPTEELCIVRCFWRDITAVRMQAVSFSVRLLLLLYISRAFFVVVVRTFWWNLCFTYTLTWYSKNMFHKVCGLSWTMVGSSWTRTNQIFVISVSFDLGLIEISTDGFVSFSLW